MAVRELGAERVIYGSDVGGRSFASQLGKVMGAAVPQAPDLKTFPLFDRATAYECVIAPGEMLFVPAHWWHYVVGLDPSITISYNFFNRANFGEYFSDLLKALPELLPFYDPTP